MNTTTEKEFNKNYFIKKFRAIKSKDIGTKLLENHCALWHCGVRVGSGINSGMYIPTEESIALVQLFGGQSPTVWSAVYNVNDGENENQKLGSNAKQRILAKLISL